MTSLTRLGAATLLGLSCLLAVSRASAQEATAASGALGSRQSFVLSLEHLGGFSYTKTEFDGADDDITSKQYGLFTPFVFMGGGRARLGAHYFVAPPLSLGGLVSYSDNDSLGAFTLIGVRIGAAFPLSGSASVWVRGGISYARLKMDFGGDEEVKFSTFLPGGELLFALKASNHFGFLAGGLFEMSMNGKVESDGGETDFKQREIALSLGAFFDF